jgi:hypothetical protein
MEQGIVVFSSLLLLTTVIGCNSKAGHPEARKKNSGRHLINVCYKLEGVITMPMQFGANGYVTYGTGK